MSHLDIKKYNKNPTKYNKITPQEYHQQLNACINCIYENICTLPFPINLSECCEKYKKNNNIYETI